ncbi:hypothetical protein PDT38_06495 [Bacillus sp. CLL-3-40]|nr:hypothetical protein [Bacillus changyiensis]MDA1476022.1 hypothetical protein [Bacillus changyiensis]
MSVILIVLTLISAAFTIGSFYYLKLLAFSSSYPPKHVLKQKTMFCVGGAGLTFLLLFFVKLLI